MRAQFQTLGRRGALLAAYGLVAALLPATGVVSAAGVEPPAGLAAPPAIRAPFWPPARQAHAQAATVRRLFRAPVSFQPNRGQSDARVRYLARSPGSALFLTPTEAVLAVQRPGSARRSRRAGRRDVVRLRFPHANPRPRITSERRLPGTASYFLGSDRSRWHTGLPTYGAVRYHELWPGIDTVFRGSASSLEYDFVVAPRADARAIALSVQGARSIELDDRGDLLLRTAGATIRQHRPVAYQTIGGRRRPVTARYRVGADGRVGVLLGRYDRSRRLVVDPVLSYSTYLGGGGTDAGYGVDVDAAGNAYLVGTTISADFPTRSPIDGTLAPSGKDAFVCKLDAAGTALSYSTYLGGNGDDEGYWIAVDALGTASITGQTGSLNFPTQSPLQPAHGGGAFDAYVAKLTPDGSALTFSTYLGGAGNDFGYGAAIDGAGNTYVSGETGSLNFPLANALQPSFGGGGDDAFVAKLSASGATLAYSTYLGGLSQDDGQSIVVDAAGSAYVTGETLSSNFPTTAGAFDRAFGGVRDAFVAKLAASGGALSYSTLLGGDGLDIGAAIEVDAAGSAYLAGYTYSTDFPVRDPVQPSLAVGGADAFVTKVAPAGSTLVYSTYLGGAGNDFGFGIGIDAGGNAYVGGETYSSQFPVVNAFQPAFGGVQDGFVASIDAGGQALRYASYLGGSDFDLGSGLAVDSAGNAYLSGRTASTDLPLRTPLQATYQGAEDAFLAKIDSSDATAPQTTIVTAPADPTTSSLATFGFTTSEPGPGSRFECRIDGGAFAPCGSPTSYPSLGQGAHTFSVRATDAYNNADPTPAQHAWAYDTTAPVARFTAAPNPSLAGRSVTFDASTSSDFGSGIARYEWDLDGDGTFEVDGGGSPVTTRTFADRGIYGVQLRISDRAGLTGTARTDQRVNAIDDPKTVGVSINDEAVYTNDRRVRIRARWPSFATAMLISNDGGYDHAVAFPLALQTPWTLESSGDELLPKTVYVRFERGLTSSDYSDTIILDERAPVVTAATVRPVKGGGAPLLQVKSRDRGASGVQSVQVTNSRSDPRAKFRAKRATIKLIRSRGERRVSLRKTIYVRVRDHAGNVSAWRVARRVRR